MAIGDDWTVNNDYTLTYTVTVDELNPAYDSVMLKRAQRLKKARRV